MKRNKRIFISFIAASALTLSTANAGSVAGFAGASEVTQIANNSQLAAQYAKQVQQYATQIQQYQTQVNQFLNQVQSYQMMLANIERLPERYWQRFAQQTMQLKNIMEQSGGMTYAAANYDQMFKKQFPTYKELLDSGKIDPTSTYRNLSEHTSETVKDALKQLNLTQADIEDDTTTMRELESLSQSAVGQKSAIQAASQIALHQTNTLKKLHQTLMMQANLQAQAIAKSNMEQDMSQSQNVLRRGNYDYKRASDGSDKLTY